MNAHSALERIVTVSPAFDGRPASKGGVQGWRKPSMKPDDGTSNTDYGVGSCRITFLLKGPAGAVQFMVGTDWYPPHVQEARAGKPRASYEIQRPHGWDVGYHSRKPMYEGQTSMGPCDYLDGGECYYDGSGLRADEWIPVLLKEGSEGIWRLLEAEYEDIFAPALCAVHEPGEGSV